MTMKAILPLLLIITLSQAAEPTPRVSYYKNGEIHVTVLGQPETKAITSGHWDFKPSWSITGDHLVFFRRLKDNPEVNNWITALCIINTDGTGLERSSLARTLLHDQYIGTTNEAPATGDSCASTTTAGR